MFRVKMLRNSEVAIIDGIGRSVCHFDMGGRCIKDSIPISMEYMDNMKALPIVSILASGNGFDVCAFHDTKMCRYEFTTDELSLTMQLGNTAGVVRILRRKGIHNNVRFNQTLFVFTENTQIFQKMVEMGGKLCD